jgi:hypothetical protein
MNNSDGSHSFRRPHKLTQNELEDPEPQQFYLSIGDVNSQ